MRPSIAGWFDSSIRVWRPTAVKDVLAVEEQSHTLVGVYEAAINRSSTAANAQGGGTTETGMLRWYGLPTIDVRPRDICDVITGPDRGHQWEVNSYPVHPRGHHTQVDCVEWHGKLPSVDEHAS